MINNLYPHDIPAAELTVLGDHPDEQQFVHPMPFRTISNWRIDREGV